MDQILRFAPEHHLTQNKSLYQIIKGIILKSGVNNVYTLCCVYPAACRFEVGCGNERVVGFHGNFTRVSPYIGFFECTPYLLTVVSGK